MNADAIVRSARAGPAGSDVPTFDALIVLDDAGTVLDSVYLPVDENRMPR